MAMRKDSVFKERMQLLGRKAKQRCTPRSSVSKSRNTRLGPCEEFWEAKDKTGVAVRASPRPYIKSSYHFHTFILIYNIRAKERCDLEFYPYKLLPEFSSVNRRIFEWSSIRHIDISTFQRIENARVACHLGPELTERN